MTEIVLDSKEDIKILDEFVSKIRNLKRQFSKENEIFQKKGVLSFGHNLQDSFFQVIDEIKALYMHFNEVQILSRLSKERIDGFNKEHEDFNNVMKEYELNTRVAAKIGDMFLDMTKGALESDTRMDIGYDKNAALMSKEKMLENMPSISINNRV